MTDLWEHYGHIKLVTAPEVKHQGRRVWCQGSTLFIGRAEGDLVAYECGMERFDNFVPRHSGPVKMRPGKRPATIWRRYVNLVNRLTVGRAWARRTQKTSTA